MEYRLKVSDNSLPDLNLLTGLVFLKKEDLIPAIAGFIKHYQIDSLYLVEFTYNGLRFFTIATKIDNSYKYFNIDNDIDVDNVILIDLDLTIIKSDKLI